MREIALARYPIFIAIRDKITFDPGPIYRKIIHFLVKSTYRPEYIGFDQIPETGPAIIVANHVSYMDGPLIDAGCKRRIRYLIDEDIYNVPGVHYLMSKNRSIPIAINRKSVEAAFDAISEGLRAGDVICIFPEGYLTFTGGLGRFKPGIEWILKRDAVPVIPIAISGLWGSVFSRKYLHSRFRWWPRNWGLKVTLKCGAPMQPERVTVNYLQQVILRIKYSLKNPRP